MPFNDIRVVGKKIVYKKRMQLMNSICLYMGGCMVKWINFGIMQSIFLQPKCGSNYYIVLYIMELLNGTHFEIINFNIYLLKLIGTQNI
jgi:hypothetical protein